MARGIGTLLTSLFFLAVTALAYGQGTPLLKAGLGYPAYSLNYLPLFFGQARGNYRAEGVDLKLLQVKSALSISAMVAGDLEFTGSATTVYSAVAQGVPVKVILYLTVKPNFYLMSSPTVKSVEALRGKVVGVTFERGLSDLMTRKIMQDHGLTPGKDVLLFSTGSTGNNLAALKGGSVSAALLSPPFNITAERQGFNKLLFTGDVFDLSMSGIGASDKLIKERSPLVKRVVKATVRSLMDTASLRPEVEQFIAKRWDLDSEAARSLYTLMGKVFSSDGSMREQTILSQARLEWGPIGQQTDLPLVRFVNLRFQQESARELGVSN